MPTDSEVLRNRLATLLPGFAIEDVACPSGQRVVYFGRFAGRDSPDGAGEWGRVAAKVSSGVAPTDIARLQREARLLNQIRSPFYPALHWSEVFSLDPLTDLPFPEGRIYITVEEWVEGRSLSALMTQYATPETVVQLLIQLTTALMLLWTQQPSIVHRDIKPENIIIRPDGRVVVIDLAIARENGTPGETHTRALPGPCTPAYCSPEQALNRKADISFKSDFFSLGTLAYTLLSGVNPYIEGREGDPYAVLEAVIGFQPPSLSAIGRASAPLSDLVLSLQQKEPFRRPRTPQLLVEELRRVEGILSAS